MKSADVFFYDAMLFMPIRMTSSYMYDVVACSKPALVGNRYGSYRMVTVMSFRKIRTLGKEN